MMKKSLTVANRFHLVKREQRGDIVHHREERVLRGEDGVRGGEDRVRCVPATVEGRAREWYTEREGRGGDSKTQRGKRTSKRIT